MRQNNPESLRMNYDIFYERRNYHDPLHRRALAEMLGVQKSTVQQLVRAGEFGPTVNVARKHLVTEDGLAGFIARRTGPAHSGLAPAPQTNYHHRHSDPGPI